MLKSPYFCIIRTPFLLLSSDFHPAHQNNWYLMLGLSCMVCLLHSFLRFCRISADSLILAREESAGSPVEEGLSRGTVGSQPDCHTHLMKSFVGGKSIVRWNPTCNSNIEDIWGTIYGILIDNDLKPLFFEEEWLKYSSSNHIENYVQCQVYICTQFWSNVRKTYLCRSLDFRRCWQLTSCGDVSGPLYNNCNIVQPRTERPRARSARKGRPLDTSSVDSYWNKTLNLKTFQSKNCLNKLTFDKRNTVSFHKNLNSGFYQNLVTVEVELFIRDKYCLFHG